MTDTQGILDGIEPELAQRLSRREIVTAQVLRLGAIATAPLLLASCAQVAASTNGLPAEVVDVLNFALTLEYLEDDFYRTGLSQPGLIPGSAQPVFQQVSKHETAHVALLQSVLGPAAVPKPAFDFTAGGTFPDVFSNFATFAALSQAFEDTGVRAYKGQAPRLMGSDQILLTALRIHSVEARHAARIRLLRRQPPWIVGESRGDLPAVVQPVYEGENVGTQGGVDLTAFVDAATATQAFDEPLTKAEVLAIAGMFLA